MRFSILTLLSLLLSFSLLTAQDDKSAEITWGKEHREPSGTYLSEIIPFGTTVFYGLRQKSGNAMESKKEKIYIERYNEKMNIVKSKENVNDLNPKNSFFI